MPRKRTLIVLAVLVGGALWLYRTVDAQRSCLSVVRENPTPVGLRAEDMRLSCFDRPGEVIALYAH